MNEGELERALRPLTQAMLAIADAIAALAGKDTDDEPQ